MDKIRWGVLGVAKIATEKVIPAMQRGKLSTVSAIASRDREKARAAAARLGIAKAYGSYEELLDDPEVSTPVTMILLHLTEHLIDGRRFVYVMTEFWKRLGDPVFTDFAKDKQKTIRKQNGLGIFDTQSPADVLRSDIARALVEQTATFFFLPNPRADHDDYVDGFKLTEAEFNIVRSMGENSRLFYAELSAWLARWLAPE